MKKKIRRESQDVVLRWDSPTISGWLEIPKRTMNRHMQAIEFACQAPRITILPPTNDPEVQFGERIDRLFHSY